MLRCPHDPRCASRRSRCVRGMPTEIIGSLTRRCRSRLTEASINSGVPATSAEGMATRSSPCDIAHSARLSPRSRKRGRPTQCRAGISDRYIDRPSQRSHTGDRHRRTSCDGAQERSPALRRRKPGTPTDSLQSASRRTPRGVRSVSFHKAQAAGAARR
jgi:hypothetical protein